MKTYDNKGEPEASVETTVDGPTLKALRALRQKKYRHSYQVNITPTGNGQTHKTLYRSFNKELMKYKCVKDVFLIAEFENTNHFHGWVYTKDKCQFKNLYNKKHTFNFRISHRENIEWDHYILKHNHKQYV